MATVFAAWIEQLREQRDQSWSKLFSREDGPIGCSGNSPGQPCKISFESTEGMTDGLCVATLAGTECWAVLNLDHAPSDYFNPMQGMPLLPLGTSFDDEEKIVAWIEQLRAKSSLSWSKAFSREDGSAGCGPEGPPGPCKINVCSGEHCMVSDGWCVAAAQAAGECWALLNPAHEPRDYVKGPGVVIP